MKVLKNILVLISSLGLVGLLNSAAYSLPKLQLDVDPGVYVAGDDETTYATSSVFNLLAFMQRLDEEDTYYLSIAVSPQMTESTYSSIGSFSINGKDYDISDFVYGTPPVDSVDSKDLQSHSVFPTYFMELKFTFSSTSLVDAYNVQDDEVVEGQQMYINIFNFDIGNLLSGFSLHFDLYTKKLVTDDKKETEYWQIVNFAPFSHDAETGDPSGPVPEPTTMLLFGTGVAGLAGIARRKRS